MKTFFAILTSTVVAILAVAVYLAQRAEEPASNLRTAKVERGDLAHTIHAEGTIKLEEVEVGSQVTGMIASFESDPANPGKAVDCGTRVRQGMVLARIESTIYRAQVDCAEASLLKTKANLTQARARLEQTEQEWKRAEGLHAVNAIADTEYDNARTNHRMAVASVAVWEAAVQECEASLCITKTNLDHTVIKSPCDGVIIDRRVNVGQTVVAAFNAPGLFLIAKDSEQVQVWASVNEADIGYIRPGLPVRFTVKARVDELFEGRVSQVRLSPSKRENTTTYTVVVSANHFGSLLPEMTAKLQFEVERHANVLLIPNDALHWPPQTSSEIQTTASINVNDALAVVGDTAAEQRARARLTVQFRKEQWANRRLWVREGERLRPIDVRTGVSNGSMTEVAGNALREGMEVVLCMKDGR